MNNFKPKAIKEASLYLQNKLDLFKKGGAFSHKKNVYVVEQRKETMFKRFVGSIFNK